MLKPTEHLDPNLVKALIGSESDFNPNRLANKKDPDSARGLMQVTNESREILNDDGGEIKDHHITATRNDLNDPNINICAGVRWLFHKRALFSNTLKRQASWLETVSGYKGTKKAPSKKRAQELIDRFKKKYEVLQKCGEK
ncbi:MAG: transglycosylase SLT domain-containing protein [Oligoflexia bacterium]|nr:transglycosylase SLT domain-containing protein [Oligoflexia bacterium]